jgi:anaerobic selenocysteine-containing dehydrogenase
MLQVFSEEGLIYMVQEYGEIDLARLLAKHEASRKEAGAQRDKLDENFIRLYWQQMLQVSSRAATGVWRRQCHGCGHGCSGGLLAACGARVWTSQSRCMQHDTPGLCVRGAATQHAGGGKTNGCVSL